MRQKQTVNSGTMADIAFLLLIFFMVTTTIQSEKGLSIVLPPKVEGSPPTVPINKRNKFDVSINSENKILVNKELVTNTIEIEASLRDFILNYGKDPNSSDAPKKAVVSLKVARGTSYKTYIQALNSLQRVYYGIYAEKMNLSKHVILNENFQSHPRYPEYLALKKIIPMNISIAEPAK